MKKFFAILLAFACFFSMAALSACTEEQADSDVVTKEEWEAAFTNTLNSYNASFTESFKWYYSESDSSEEKLVMTNDKTVQFGSDDGEEGIVYYLADANYYLADGTTHGCTYTRYSVNDESGYFSVDKELIKSSGTEYYGGTDKSGAAFYVTWYIDEMINFSDYDLFEYKDGAYVFSYEYIKDEIDYNYVVGLGSLGVECLSQTFKVKINDGYVTSIEAEGVVIGMDLEELTKIVVSDLSDYSEYLNYIYGTDTATNTFKYELNFSDYNSTSIEIPEEYTYDYYLEHSKS